MIRCPDAGALRAALDDERPDVAAHVAQCAACGTRSAAYADDAAFAAAHFADPAPSADLDVDAALARVRLQTAPPDVAVERPSRLDGAGLLRVAASVAAVLILGVVLITPGGRSAAASLLERFRAERVAPVPVNIAAVDPAALEALVEVAEIEGLDRVADPQRVPDLGVAADVAGFAATPLDRDLLPASITGPTVVLAHAPQTVRISFPERSDVAADIRGVTLVLQVPGVVVQRAGGDEHGPVAIRGEAGELEVVVEGDATLTEVRDALLSLPGLPEETIRSLRAIQDWETTLPVPVPVGQIAWSETTVAGRPAVAFGDETGVGSVLLWHDGVRFVGVGGTLPLSRIRELAESGE